ncbi:hypothetical protein E2C01_100402 [Portunus trituberculatus]|uniref:Uncharacterized protein n=1 Tax=Portunus trituberculatus TaxID=210409 RepID=A0A5B7KHW1_PORTR|nr:hypothetical protein [Portunus trituberculatus]
MYTCREDRLRCRSS